MCGRRLSPLVSVLSWPIKTVLGSSECAVIAAGFLLYVVLATGVAPPWHQQCAGLCSHLLPGGLPVGHELQGEAFSSLCNAKRLMAVLSVKQTSPVLLKGHLHYTGAALLS